MEAGREKGISLELTAKTFFIFFIVKHEECPVFVTFSFILQSQISALYNAMKGRCIGAHGQHNI